MSSGFVSGGTADAPIERSDEWLAAQKEIEANALRKADQARQQADGRSLFETLEANKAAKQEAFEEANRLKNQFRGVDEDEAEWLDSVLESTRAEEDRVKKETREGLALFRQQQDEADKKARAAGGGTVVEAGSPTVEQENWVAGGRKRKRAKEGGLKGVKIRRASTTEGAKPAEMGAEKQVESPKTITKLPEKSDTLPAATELKPHMKGTSGLVSYGSDEDDDW